MKKRKISMLGLFAAAALGTIALSSCKNEESNQPVVDNLLNITGTNYTISVSDAEKLDLKTLFSIQFNGSSITVTDDMINKGEFKAEKGKYNIVLTYNGQTATSIVNVVDSVGGSQSGSSSLQLTGSNDIVEIGDIDNFDLTDLFKIHDEGTNVTVTESMIDDGGFTNEAGTYTVILTYKGKTVTSTIKVVHNYEVSILPNYEALNVKKGENFDITQAFKVYVGSEPVAVTEDMVSSNVDLNRVGKYPVSIVFDRFGEIYEGSTKINVLPDVLIETPNGDSFEGKGVYISNDMFNNANNFKVLIDGHSIEVNDSMIETNVTTVPGSNKIQTGEYTTTCKFKVDGVEFSKSIEYNIYEHSVTLSHDADGETFKKSELTADNFNALDLFNLKIDGYMTSSSSVNLQFVEESKVDTTEAIEGKTIVPYKVISNIEYGKIGDYQVAIAFKVDGLDYIDTVDVHIVSDVVITTTSSKDVTLFSGLESYDYKSLFKITKYDAATATNNTIEITDAMIDASKVNLAVAGTYTVTCEYEDVSFQKTIIVTDAPFVGSYTSIGSDTVTLSINADATVLINNGGTETSGTCELQEDGSIKITTGSSYYGSIYTCQYMDGILTFDKQHTSVQDTDCFIFAKDINSWNVKQVSGFLNNKTAVSSVGDTEYIITNLSKKDSDQVINIFFSWTYVSSEYDYNYYEYIDVYNAEYFINPSITGTLFTDTCEVVLGKDTVVYTFTTTDDVISFNAVKKATSSEGGSGTTEPDTPSVGEEAGTYTGSEGTLVLDGKGKATVSDSTTIVPNSNGISYMFVGNKCLVSWKDSSYTGHNLVVILGDGTYAIDEENDGFKRRYNSATSSYTYMDFLGNGIVNAYSIFKYGEVYASYTVNNEDKTVTVTYEDKQITLSLDNGENDMFFVSYPEDLYAVSNGHKSFVSTTILNHKLTVSPMIEVAQGGTVSIDDLFKIEYLNGETIEKVVLTPEIVDTSAVDTSELGYYVATLKYAHGGYEYEGSAIIHTYEVPYKDRDEVGTYYFDASYAEKAYLKLNPDGTAEFNPYGYTAYSGTWTIGESGDISIDCGSSYQLSAVYDNGILNVEKIEYGTPKYYYYFKDGIVQKKYEYYSSSDSIYKVLTVAKNADGIINYYYSDGADFYGEVNVFFADKVISDNSVIEIQKGDNILLEAKVSGTTLILAGSEKGSYSGTKGTIVLDGFGNATVAGAKATYSISKYIEITLNGGETFVINCTDTSYEVLETDAMVGTYTNGSFYLKLDGFGSGVFYRYSNLKIAYSYTEGSNTVTVQTFKYDGVTVDDTFGFEIQPDGSLKCTSTTYSGYIAVDSIWSK